MEPQRDAALEARCRPVAMLALAAPVVPAGDPRALHGRRGAQRRDDVHPGRALGLPRLVLPLERHPPRRRAVHPAGLPQLVAAGGLQPRGRLPHGAVHLHGFRLLMLHQDQDQDQLRFFCECWVLLIRQGN